MNQKILNSIQNQIIKLKCMQSFKNQMGIIAQSTN